MNALGILHSFQRKRLAEANSIPAPSTPFEKHLAQFFVGSSESEAIKNEKPRRIKRLGNKNELGYGQLNNELPIDDFVLDIRAKPFNPYEGWTNDVGVSSGSPRDGLGQFSPNRGGGHWRGGGGSSATGGSTAGSTTTFATSDNLFSPENETESARLIPREGGVHMAPMSRR